MAVDVGSDIAGPALDRNRQRRYAVTDPDLAEINAGSRANAVPALDTTTLTAAPEPTVHGPVAVVVAPDG